MSLRLRFSRQLKVVKLALMTTAETVARHTFSQDDLDQLDDAMVDALQRTFRRSGTWAKEQRATNACEQCGSYGLFYMLRDEVWSEVTGRTDGSGRFCLPCAAGRLGRAIEPGDLSIAPINEAILYFCSRAKERKQ